MSDPLVPPGDGSGLAASVSPRPSPIAQASGPRGPGNPESFVRAFFNKIGEKNIKTKRWTCQCQACGEVFPDAKPNDLTSHIVMRCTRVSSEIRSQVLERSSQERRAKRPSVGTLPSGGNSNRKVVKQPSLGAFTQRSKLAPHLQREADLRLARWMVHTDVDFAAADSPFFLEWLESISKPVGYTPAGSRQLANELLPELHDQANTDTDAKLAAAQYVTLLQATWTGVQGRHLLAFLAVTPDRNQHLLGTADGEDLSSSYLEGELTKAVARVGARKVAAIVCTSAAATAVAQQLVASCPGHEHILAFRCHMRGLSTVLATILTNPWASDTTLNAVRLAAAVRASPRLLARVRAAAPPGATLQLPGRSSVLSLLSCLEAVVQLEPALRGALTAGQSQSDNPDTGAAAGGEAGGSGGGGGAAAPGSDSEREAAVLAGDRGFWSDAALLARLLRPLAGAAGDVGARARGGATLASMTRRWIELAGFITEAAACLPEDLTAAIAYTYQSATSTLNIPLCRLAMLLDPSCRGAAAAPTAPDKWAEVLTSAGSILKTWGHDSAAARAALTQLSAYRSGEAQYALSAADAARAAAAGTGGGFDRRAWWRGVSRAHNETLVALALLMADIVPHASATQGCPFGEMGWFDEARRLVGGAQVMAVKLHLENQAVVAAAETASGGGQAAVEKRRRLVQVLEVQAGGGGGGSDGGTCGSGDGGCGNGGGAGDGGAGSAADGAAWDAAGGMGGDGGTVSVAEVEAALMAMRRWVEQQRQQQQQQQPLQDGALAELLWTAWDGFDVDALLAPSAPPPPPPPPPSIAASVARPDDYSVAAMVASLCAQQATPDAAAAPAVTAVQGLGPQQPLALVRLQGQHAQLVGPALRGVLSGVALTPPHQQQHQGEVSLQGLMLTPQQHAALLQQLSAARPGGLLTVTHPRP